MNLLEFKIKIRKHCIAHEEERLKAIHEMLLSQQQAANNETKSSAGDKYETGRAMAHLEIEKLGKQHALHEKNLSLLAGLKDHLVKQVQSGCLVKTDSGIFYLSVSIGEICFEQQNIYVLSPLAPLVQQMLGKRSSDQILFNGRTIKILDVA